MWEDLTSRQKTFVLEYFKSKSQKKAAIAAGYSEKSADVQASRLLANEKIQKAIKQLEQKKQADLRALFVEESRVAFNDILELVGELKHDSSQDVRKQRLLFDMLNSILDRAGYKAPDKLQAEIESKTNVFEDMTKEELISYIKQPTLAEKVENEGKQDKLN